MHDLDRTLDTSEAELEALGADDDEGELEAELEGEYELEGFDDDEVFDEAEEMELAAELLSISDDQELEQFLGSLIRKVGSKVRKFAKSSTGRALGGLLKSVAKKALPIAGRAAGAFFGGPAGAAIGGKLASFAGKKLFGLELEGMSPEDQEFEVARRVVRLCAAAARKASLAPKGAPATQVARAAVQSAARRHAPGLLGRGPQAAVGGHRRSGRWIRRGRKIILLGA
jgi:hypothetical protein